jgi:NADH-quinone oxidoreductase subunit L
MTETASLSIFNFTPWVVFFPLIGLLLNLIFGKKWGEKVTGLVACLATGLSFALSAALLLSLRGSEEAIRLKLADWITVGSFDVSWIFRIDTLSTVMMLVVTGVGLLIHIYATGYMHDDVRHNNDTGRYRRFFVYFNLFLLAMLILVTADNYLMLFVGWEGVGLCSYLLIGFWFEKGADGIGNAQAGKKAFIVNRIGDFGLLIAMFLIFGAFGTLQFDAVFEQASGATVGLLIAITLFMLLGVSGKSAQLPLYVWLPDAMAGPTPVSALIHAATMVTAGVYLVVRSSALFMLAPAASSVVMWVGALTAIFAATIAVAQNDIKKVLAYSTISQLGFMVAAAGMGAYVAAMFHLATHAFFKALLFLSSGSVIQGMERGAHHAGQGHAGGDAIDPQDMRNMGGLDRRMKLTFLVYLVGALAIAGVAPLSGFFSKDEILGAASTQSLPVYIILSIAAFLTAFYMGRQVFLVFSGKPRSAPAEHATESAPVITVPLVILAVLSVFGGLLNLPGVHTLGHWLEHSLAGGLEVEFSFTIAGISLVIALAGLILAWVLYGRVSLAKNGFVDPLASKLGGLFKGMQNKWWVDELYHTIIVRPYKYIANVFLGQWFDQEVIDGAVNDTGKLANVLSGFFRKTGTGYIRTYALGMLLGLVVIVLYVVLRF